MRGGGGAGSPICSVLTPSGGHSPQSLLRERVSASFRLSTVDSYYAAIADLGQLVKSFPSELDLLELRGTAYFNIGELSGAQSHFTACLKMDAEHKGCKKEVRALSRAWSEERRAITVPFVTSLRC